MPETSNDDLARMIKKGFDGVDDSFRTVHDHLDKIDIRLDHIEHAILADHQKRIERIEQALAIPTKA
jgi:hypothetical protein